MRFIFLLAIAVIIYGCDKKGGEVPVEDDAMTVSSDTIVESFVGNGPDWGGYDVLNYLIGQNTLSDDDWNTLFKRVSFMRPSYTRIMMASGWNYLVNGAYDPSKSDAVLCRILQYCEKNGITVQLGEWGHTGGTSIDEDWVEEATDFLKYLIVTKGYDCIKYYTIVNEPNGSWSTIDGNYSLWKSIIEDFYEKLDEKGLGDVKIMGPDVSVSGTGETDWVLNTKKNLNKKVEAYDVHAYPTDKIVHSAGFLDLARTYKACVDKNRIIMLTEMGFKYGSKSSKGIENAARISADGNAADDSQMMAYDSFYGIDMADATIQAMMAGFSGVAYWDLDDAMYNSDAMASRKLKKWGYWNIIGSECYSDPDDENIRPWFYTTSLLCRYFPAGTAILSVTLPKSELSGLRAIAGEKNGKMTIAIVNSGSDYYSFDLKMAAGACLDSVKLYRFKALDGSEFEGEKDANGFAVPEDEGGSLDFTCGRSQRIQMDAQSFLLITNMD